MQIRTFVVWGAARWAIYVGGLLFVAALTGWFIAMPTLEYSTAEKLPAVLVPIAWWAISFTLYRYRKAWEGQIFRVTPAGISVVPGDAKRWMADRVHMFDRTMADVMQWWAQHFIRLGYTDATEVIADAFNGTTVEVVVTTEGLSSERHGIRKKAGLAWPGRLVIQLRPDDMDTGAVFWATLSHEAGHNCLYAMNIAQDEHHAFMKAAGWGYA